MSKIYLLYIFEGYLLKPIIRGSASGCQVWNLVPVGGASGYGDGGGADIFAGANLEERKAGALQQPM